jgi:cytoskeletal protein RodZ
MVALFNRRKNQTNVPEEIQEYYQTERRERAGVAWMLAIGTLLITIMLTAGIFFAGRWAWREIAGPDEPQIAENQDEQQAPQEAAQDTPNEPGTDQPTEEPGQDPAPSAEDTEDEPTPAQQPDQTEEQPAADSQDDEQGHTSSANTGGTGTGARSVAGANTTVPETGPADTVAIFFAVSVVGYLAHRFWNRATE